MLKRFYSKRSGFTLVEIVIAFAVFAIMASMICQILQLSVAARNSNNIYQRELAKQQAALTVIEKTSKDFDKEAGSMQFTFTDGTKVEIPYAMISANPDLEGDDRYSGEGHAYFLGNVNYQANGEISPGGGSESPTGSGTGSLMSRMDTRLTGTGGIGFIRICDVIKDENTYAEGDPYAVPEGYTRYFISCSASSSPHGGSETLLAEDVPHSQYRLYFYDDKKLNAAAGAVPYKDAKGNEYKKIVPATLEISKVGYLNCSAETAAANGLNASRVTTGTTVNYNRYTVDKMGTNCVRIGSPIISGSGDGLNNNGKRFESSLYSNFYVEFKGDDVTITNRSFGNNGEEYHAENGTLMGIDYEACPMYKDEYDTDGKPTYAVEKTEVDGKKVDKYHVNIYGANLYTRDYTSGTKTPGEGDDTPDEE